ncbi:MAG: ATP-binding protein, partial [Acidimicrobiales bacterium]
MIDIGVLGPLTVQGPGGDAIAIASTEQRRLVSVLALHVDDLVRAASLEFWLDLSPGALRTSISRLRRVLGSDAVRTTPPGYTLRATVDAARFDGLVSHAPAVDDDRARTTLEEALGLWRGDPLDEFAHEPWAEAEVSRLHEQFATAVEDLSVLLLEAGEASTAMFGIQALIDRQPYRDRPRALLMRALVDCGRRTEALRAFQDYRSLLRDEIGTDPSEPVHDLDRAIAALAEDRVLAEPHPSHPAWHRARSRRTGADPARSGYGLPLPLSSFVGRSDDLATVVELLRVNRLVTLTGAGGCGKTRLAIAAAGLEAEHRGGPARWADLGLVPHESRVVEQLAAAVGLALAPGSDEQSQLVAHLSGAAPVMAVLDNAEHVLAAVVEIVSELLPRCPALRILVTSRESLGLAGEVVWRVPSLATPPVGTPVTADQLAEYDATRLFLERAQAARPGLVVDDEAATHVLAICAGVDGLPLAVELAAARTRTLPIEVVAGGIGDAVRWQRAGIGAPLARHATLHACIAWSVGRVDPAARSVLVRLSVFQGSFTLESASAVGAGDEIGDEAVDGVVAAISALVDASLVQLDDTSGRYRMLQTVRKFCSLPAVGADQLHGARARHARHIAAYCAAVGNGSHGIERGPLVRSMPDMVAALEWARRHEPLLAFEMCAGLAAVRTVLGHNTAVVDTWEWLLALDRSTADAGWSVAWAGAVAATMSAATANRIDVSGVVEEVRGLLPPGDHRAHGWLARGAAMAPAYRGILGPIVAHTEDSVARGDDVETSVYGGFAAYMLAL